MLKTNAEGLKTVIRKKEGYHHPTLHVSVIPGDNRSDFRVRVEADESLIDDMMDEYASAEYLDNQEQTRRRVGPTTMEFY